ncbi:MULTISPECIES: hypothetical protein [unclassified Thioalkalivibrio]|uniref:hypothetical protein n=1 Tax=unclassified Thioalkalivibrio TaxID=2621013 RepID=UPI00035C4D67|nr:MULTISPECIES: hypothetical protein [unclassified Thioalkalivibrio]
MTDCEKLTYYVVGEDEAAFMSPKAEQHEQAAARWIRMAQVYWGEIEGLERDPNAGDFDRPWTIGTAFAAANPELIPVSKEAVRQTHARVYAAVPPKEPADSIHVRVQESAGFYEGRSLKCELADFCNQYAPLGAGLPRVVSAEPNWFLRRGGLNLISEKEARSQIELIENRQRNPTALTDDEYLKDAGQVLSAMADGLSRARAIHLARKADAARPAEAPHRVRPRL